MQSLENELGKDPWQAFENWYGLSLKLKVPNPNWVVLSTSDLQGTPDSRVVLLKDYGISKGFIFFTNYESQKSKQMLSNSKVALLFFWDELKLQIRVQGNASKTLRSVSQAYFNTRPRMSQIGALASKQSQILNTRSDLELTIQELNSKFTNEALDCPNHWGGWQVNPYKFEFWRNQESRLHDRIRYSLVDGAWQMHRLYP